MTACLPGHKGLQPAHRPIWPHHWRSHCSRRAKPRTQIIKTNKNSWNHKRQKLIRCRSTSFGCDYITRTKCHSSCCVHNCSDVKSSRPKWPRAQNFGLGLGLETLALASALRFRPQSSLDLIVLLCNRAFFVQKSCKIQ